MFKAFDHPLTATHFKVEGQMSSGHILDCQGKISCCTGAGPKFAVLTVMEWIWALDFVVYFEDCLEFDYAG